MQTEKIRKLATYLIILLFLAPVIGTLLSLVGTSKEAQQYGVLQVILMGMYNIPFLVVSFICLFGGNSVVLSKPKLSRILLTISLLSSVLGVIAMLAWGLGLL